jgi:septum formation protein
VSEPRIILASSSPRRRELLKLVGIAHEVKPADIDESIRDGEKPHDFAERLAREKAELVDDGADSGQAVIGADTIVVIDDQVLGKPRDAKEAETMLGKLSGRTHTVITAVAVCRSGETWSSVEEVTVTFRKLSRAEIKSYIATGEPMDKAGAYGIQGFGATIVDRVEGDYFAVMGLPLARLVRLLAEAGVRYDFGKLSV